MDLNTLLLETVRDSGHQVAHIKSLLDSPGVSVNFANPCTYQTALHIAANQGNGDVVKLLLSCGAHINGCTADLMTPLHEASLGGHVMAVKILIDEGAEVNARNIDGSTPLCLACSKGSVQCAHLLTESGAEVNASLMVTFPALHEAALNGHVHCLNMLMQKGADVNKSENQFGTALHAACLRGYVDCVQTLLHAGANPNAIKRHQSPLHITALCGYKDCLELLIEYGANVYQRNSQSKRAVDLTMSESCQEILRSKAETPARLKQSCRLLIRQMLGCMPADKISYLPLPSCLKEYLNHYVSRLPLKSPTDAQASKFDI